MENLFQTSSTLAFKMAMSVIVVTIARILYQLQYINATNRVLVIQHNIAEVLGVWMLELQKLSTKFQERIKMILI